MSRHYKLDVISNELEVLNLAVSLVLPEQVRSLAAVTDILQLEHMSLRSDAIVCCPSLTCSCAVITRVMFL